jgi:TPR repeat protein
MKSKITELSCRLIAFAAFLALLSPLQAIASGTEARRAYVLGNHLLALQLARPAAEQGDGTAMLVLGTLYFRGEGVRQDHAAALKWWSDSAALGNVRAQNNVGVIFRGGLGVERNYEEAIKWFELAAANGDAYAHWNLGLMHENGQKFPIDVEKALELYKKALDLFSKELIAEPENRKTTRRWIDVFKWRVNWLTSVLSKPNPTIPMPNTPQSDRNPQITAQ